MGERFKDREHLVRMAGLFAAGAVVFLLLRGVLTPADYGELGHYRAGALTDNRSVARQYAGRAACEMCHDDVAAERAGGKHQGIGCEACHGALAVHADDPSAVAPDLPTATPLCVACHRIAVAIPQWFPQVEPESHSEGAACDECHAPHNPGI